MPNHIGLDLGSHSIKLVALEKKGKAFRIIGVSHGPTPAGAWPPKHPQEEKALTDAIKVVREAARVKTKNVVLSVHESQVFTRVISMPLLSDRELASALRWEAEQYIPLPIEEVVYQHQIMSRPKEEIPGAKMEVFLIACRKTFVEQYRAIAERAGLTAVGLETEMVALSRALVGNNPYSPTTMIVHIGANETDFCVVRGGMITFTRSITTGGNALTRAIGSELGFEPMQAEQYKQAYGLNAEMEGKIAKALSPIINILIGEMNRSIAFYRSKNPHDPIKRVTVSGGSARLPGLIAYLAQQTGVETQRANPFFGMEHAQGKGMDEDSPRFAVATGLALKEDV